MLAGFAIAVSVLIGVIIGVGIVGLQVKNPLFGELFHQQKEILKVQEKDRKAPPEYRETRERFAGGVKKLKSPRAGEQEEEEDYQKIHEINIDNSLYWAIKRRR